MICDSETTDSKFTVSSETSENQEALTIAKSSKNGKDFVLNDTKLNTDSIDQQSKANNNEPTTEVISPSAECINNEPEIKTEARTNETPTLPNNSRLDGFSSSSDLNLLNAKETKAYLKSNSDNEIIDVSSKNILNICIGTECGVELRNELRSKIRQSVGVHAEQAPTDKPKSMVEVLSSSDSSDNSEIADFNKSVELISSKMHAIATVGAPSVLEERISDSENRSLDSLSDPSLDVSGLSDQNNRNDQNEQNNQNACIKCSNSNHGSNYPNEIAIQPNALAKSSAITFFCENLDELKRIDGDSDGSFEEI